MLLRQLTRSTAIPSAYRETREKWAFQTKKENVRYSSVDYKPRGVSQEANEDEELEGCLALETGVT